MSILRFLTSGESHGPELLAILEGIPAGLSISEDIINHQLDRRQRGSGAGNRMKIEKDQATLVSGLMDGKTIGSPIGIRITNLNHEEWRGKEISPFTIPRPGHVDLAGALKYGYQDLRPSLERASARETAARTAVGTICRHFLEQFSIQVGGWVSSIGPVVMESVQITGETFPDLVERAEATGTRCPDPATAKLMDAAIREVKKAGDTLGGVIEIAVMGLPPGLGSFMHWDRKLDSRLGAAVLGIPAIKGIEIGRAFENSKKRGTEIQDPIRSSDGNIYRPTNRAGGMEGGVTNGNPLIIRAAMKPIATTITPQQTVDLINQQESTSKYERSDFCPVPRAVPIIEAVISFILADALIEKLGGDSLAEMLPRFNNLPKSRFSDLNLDNEKHIWWPE